MNKVIATQQETATNTGSKRKGRPPKYRTDEERRAAKRASARAYYARKVRRQNGLEGGMHLETHKNMLAVLTYLKDTDGSQNLMFGEPGLEKELSDFWHAYIEPCLNNGLIIGSRPLAHKLSYSISEEGKKYLARYTSHR